MTRPSGGMRAGGFGSHENVKGSVPQHDAVMALAITLLRMRSRGSRQAAWLGTRDANRRSSSVANSVTGMLWKQRTYVCMNT